jgi:hypothetical protein
VLSLGHSVNVLMSAQRSCAALFIVSEQGLQEVLYLKYMAMEESGRSEQNVTAQKYIDQMGIDSVKKALMRNYVSTFPEGYKNIMEFTTWEEMSDWVTEEVSQGNKIS